MAEIRITEEYSISTDPLNYILKHTHQTMDRKTKELTGKSREEVIGYYSRLGDAIDGYLRFEQKQLTDDFKGTLKEYVRIIEQVTKSAENRLTQFVEGKGEWHE